MPRQIESTDRQIDQLFYQLYDLTEEEIKNYRRRKLIIRFLLSSNLNLTETIRVSPINIRF